LISTLISLGPKAHIMIKINNKLRKSSGADYTPEVLGVGY
jgi:hypothetical protein